MLINLYSFLEPEHALMELVISIIITRIRIIRIRVMVVKELNYVESAAVYVEVNVPLLEIRRYGLPYLYFRMQFLDFAPCGISDAFAVDFGRDKQYLKITSVAFGFQDNAADLLAFQDDPVGFSCVNGM